MLFTIEANVRHRYRNTGECWPSLDTIAKEALLARSTVALSIAKLRRIGWLDVTQESTGMGRKRNVYRVTPPTSTVDASQVPETTPDD